MSTDLTQFHGVFFEECFEALDSMEAALLKLDIGAPDKELINTIFRVAHSIKGGSATFGFSDVASFTHSLETLLDELRGGTMQVTQEMSDVLLKSVDVMRGMLRAVQQKQPVDAQRVSDLQFDLELMMARKSLPSAAIPPGAIVAPPATPLDSAPTASPATPVAAAAHWEILFRPYPQLFARGNDPLRMIRELTELGQVETRAQLDTLPAFGDFDPKCCYLSWNINLTGSVDENAIRQIFEWADGDCDLQMQLLGGPSNQAVPGPPSEPAAPTDDDTAPTLAGPATVSPASVAVKSDSPLAPADSGSIRVSVDKLDELMNIVGELVITQAMLSQLGGKIEGPTAELLRGGLAELERNMRELQDTVTRVRMLPINVVFNRFPRMVHDLAQRLGKQIDLELSGVQTELDKTVLEKIGDPLVHLVRNSIDHGIEPPEVRTSNGKPATGTIRLDACHRGGNIAVEVSDDGGGLDRNRILAKARDRGLIGATDVLTDEQLHELIFMPGFSTVEKPTDVSGRGVGMDVVRRNINELGGKIELRSEAGRGSKTIITLPLTLAIVDGQSVSVGTETYIVPLISIVESLQLMAANVSVLPGQGEVFLFRGYYLPIVRLHELFAIEPRTKSIDEGLMVVAEGEGHQRIGLFVDDLLGQQQVVIKSLETNYGHVEGVSGATILGDGTVALILDIPALIGALSMCSAA